PPARSRRLEVKDGASLHAFLEIRPEGAGSTRRMLTESPLIIGRVPGVGLHLDHHTVSRRHAEMVCDPFGRWWIRDLGSTNGTTIGPEAIAGERVLSPGDVPGIGDYSLTFVVEPAAEVRETFDIGLGDDDKPTVIRRLFDLEPPRIAAAHLRTLLELSKNLASLSDPAERRDALCALIVRDDFHAANAVVIRVEGRRRYRPLSRVHRVGQERPAPSTPPGGGSERQLYISRRVLDMLHDSREPVLASNVATRFEGTTNSIDMSMARDLSELWVLAVPF